MLGVAPSFSVGRRRVCRAGASFRTYLFFIANVLVFYALSRSAWRACGGARFLRLG